MPRCFVVLLAACLVSACGDTKIYQASPTAPAPVVDSSRSTIDYRVTGNASSVRIRYVNPVDGTTVVTTALPYVATATTTQTTFFVALEATPLSYPVVTGPVLVVQVFVNGSLFREASAADLSATTVSVSGTYRAN